MRAPVLAALFLLLVGCTTSVQVKPASVRPAYVHSAAGSLAADSLSSDSASLLKLAARNWWLLSTDERLDALWASQQISDRERLFAAAEVALLEARRLESRGDPAALDHYLLAAAMANDFLAKGALAGAAEIRRATAVSFYNAATAKVALAALRGQGAASRVSHVWRRTFALTFAPSAAPTRAYYDRFELARAYDLAGLRHRHVVAGLGVPLIGFRDNHRRDAIERFYPPEGIVGPVTATLHFGAASSGASSSAASGPRWQATLCLSDPRHSPSIALGAESYPLAADFTAPMAYLLAHTELRLLALTGLLNGDAADWHRGVFLLEPYDPEKTPILMVHGLFSSPLIWRDLSNDIEGAPELRSRYQIWHYMYPTGTPFLISAERFRADVEELLSILEAHSGRPVKPLVLIGHSMGGLLIKTAMVDSGPALWDAISRVPFEQAHLADGNREILQRYLFLQRKPWVGRAIFLAVPHRGSLATTSFPGRLAQALMSLPEDTLLLDRRLDRDLGDTLRPEIPRPGTRPPTSLSVLAPSDQVLRALAALSPDPAVPFHSIIGVPQRTADGEEFDGIVTRSSAHQEGAASELLVPVSHRAFNDPRVVAEIFRILGEHQTADHPSTPSTSAVRPQDSHFSGSAAACLSPGDQ